MVKITKDKEGHLGLKVDDSEESQTFCRKS